MKMKVYAVVMSKQITVVGWLSSYISIYSK